MLTEHDRPHRMDDPHEGPHDGSHDDEAAVATETLVIATASKLAPC